MKAGDIPRRTFGKTGVELSVFGPGGARFALIPFEEGTALVRQAYDLGVNFFDNARSYWGGHSEDVYGAVLPEFRKKVFITTKSTQRTRKGAEADLAESLRRLKTDYVDLWQIHGIQEKDEVARILGPGGAMEAFEAAKKAGKCRFIGFTGHHDPNVHLEMLRAYDKFDSILMPLHIADPLYLSFEKITLPAAVERGIAIKAMKTLGNAFLLRTFTARDCLHYVLSLPIHVISLGFSTIGQLEDDVRAVRDFRPLSEEQKTALHARAARLKGPELEYWKRNVEKFASPI